MVASANVKEEMSRRYYGQQDKENGLPPECHPANPLKDDDDECDNIDNNWIGNNTEAQSDISSDATSIITLIVLPATFPWNINSGEDDDDDDDDDDEEEASTDLKEQHDAPDDDCRSRSSFSTLSSMDSFFAEEQDDSSSFDQQPQPQQQYAGDCNKNQGVILTGASFSSDSADTTNEEEETQVEPLLSSRNDYTSSAALNMGDESLLQHWDDRYFTEGFVCVGQLLGAY